ncbi:MAG: restriction endonuclease subunit S [Planctomycetia bacterium]|nr:restriction endonuclease subunit S [Planctomycetia bacterium]
MSKLAELIRELCPNGVEWKTLGEVASYATKRINAELINENNYVGVENLLPNKLGKTTSSYVPSEGRLIAFQKSDILIGNIRPYLKKIWLATLDGGTNGDVLALRVHDKTTLSPQFLYYVLSSDQFFRYDMQNAKGAKMPRGNKELVLQYPIPVPPLPVQEEIVRILDIFTELTAELTARRKQYEYYRDLLLNFDKCQTGGGGQNRHSVPVVWKTIKEICEQIVSGGTPKTSHTDYYNGTIPWLRTQEVDWKDIWDTSVKITEDGIRDSTAQWIPPNCVIIAMYGATAAKAAINRIPLTTNQACCNLKINKSIAMYRYVFYWFCKEYETLKALGRGSQSNINGEIIKNFPIPIPPLSEQARIVSILDRFDALCNDLTSGLPAEIEARKKQYEYYRDKLLTFAEV